MGDALAMVLIDAQKFPIEDYAMNHPAGAIGRALVMKVTDVMRSGERFARVTPDNTIMESLMAMTKAKSGSAAIVDGSGRLVGIFTDGDFRRAVSEKRVDLNAAVSTVMTSPAMFVRDDVYAADLLKIFEKKRIDDLPVCDADGKVVGVVDIQDLPKMKIM